MKRGFEGSAALSQWQREVLGDVETDDPSFQTVAQIAAHVGVSQFTIRRWIAAHPKHVECRLVRRAECRSPIRVYKLKGKP